MTQEEPREIDNAVEWAVVARSLGHLEGVVQCPFSTHKYLKSQ